MKSYRLLMGGLLTLFTLSPVYAMQPKAYLDHLFNPEQADVDLRSALLQNLKWGDDCEDTFTNHGNPDYTQGDGLSYFRLNSKQFLVQVSCGWSAYQPSYYYVFVDQPTEKMSLVSFKTVDWNDNNEVITVTNQNITGLTKFNDGLLSVFNKARGAGDCGSYITYGFKSNATSYVVTARARACDDDNADSDAADYEHWPIVLK